MARGELLKTVLFGFLITAAFLFLTIVVHESAHVIAALLMGIPVINFDWFDPRYIAPTITFGHTGNELGMAVVKYAGGLTAGTLWLSVYIVLLLKRYTEKSLNWWLLGLFVAMLAFWQIGQGLLEGRLHQIYISGAGKLGGVSFILQCLFILLGFLVYLQQTRLWREIRQKKVKNSK